MRHPNATRRVSVRSWRELLLLGFAACFLLMIGIVTIRSNGDGTTGRDSSRIQRQASRDYTSLREVAPEDGKTLVIYVYHESNAMYIENLQFFMDVSMLHCLLSLWALKGAQFCIDYHSGGDRWSTYSKCGLHSGNQWRIFPSIQITATTQKCSSYSAREQLLWRWHCRRYLEERTWSLEAISIFHPSK